jgi:hypothetical protein
VLGLVTHFYKGWRQNMQVQEKPQVVQILEQGEQGARIGEQRATPLDDDWPGKSDGGSALTVLPGSA